MSTNTQLNHNQPLSEVERIHWKDPGPSAPQINSRLTPELISFISWVARSSGESQRFPFFMSFSLFRWAVTHIDSENSPFELPNDQIDPVGYYEKIVNITQEAIIFYQNVAGGAEPLPCIPTLKKQATIQGEPISDSIDKTALTEGYKSEIEFLRAQLLKKDEIIQSGQSTINTLSQLLAAKQTQG